MKKLLFLLLFVSTISCMEEGENCDVTLKFVNQTDIEMQIYVDFVLDGSSDFDLGPHSRREVKLDNSLFSEHYYYYEWFSEDEGKLVRRENTIQTHCGYSKTVYIN